MLWPDPDQHDPGCLHEQRAQIAIAAPGYLAEDGTVSRRYLLWHQSEPGAEVAAFGECSTVADRGDRRTRDDRPDAGHRHQPVACRVPTGQRSDLAGQDFDGLIEPMPIVSQSLDEVQHAWRQDVCAFGKYAGQFDAQEAQPLAHRNAALQQEGANLIADAGALADQPLAHAVKGLQVELIAGLGGDEPHRRTLHRFGDRLMPVFILPFPAIDPVAIRRSSVAISVGPFIVRWYALAYIFGFVGCWAYASALLRKDRLWSDTPRPNPQSLIGLALYAMLGTVIGGRLGQVIFYEPGYYAAHPAGDPRTLARRHVISRRSNRGPVGDLVLCLPSEDFIPHNCGPRCYHLSDLHFSGADRKFHQFRALGPSEGCGVGNRIPRGHWLVR